MTTMNSDSESQDSDDGRRFRFEATRKDDTLRLQSHNRRRSPLSKSSSYRSRSTDRGNHHNRRDYDKGKLDRDRKEGGVDRDNRRKNSREKESKDNKYDSKNISKESSRYSTKGNIKDTKETYESKNSMEIDKRSADSKNSTHRDNKDHKNSKDCRSRESKNSSIRSLKETKIRDNKDARDQELRSPRDRESKDFRDRERGPKRHRDTSHERLSGANKHGHRSREKYKIRERSDNREKSKQLADEKAEEDRNKNSERTKSPRKKTDRKNMRRDTHSPSKILERIGSDCESDLGALDPDIGSVMALDTLEDCGEMNLSDFEIISDTEGSSSSETLKTEIPAEGPIVKGEILAPHYYGPKITKRVSRRQYERLVRRQSAINTRRLEELYKVNPGKNENIRMPHQSNNNPSAVSDFLLGPEAVGIGEHRGSQIKELENNEDSNSDDNKSDAKYNTTNENKLKIKSFDNKIYGPSLPPKHQKENTVIITTEKNPSAENQISIESRNAVIGPSLPPEFAINSESQKSDCEDSSSSNTKSEKKSVPIIGPSLPPYIQRENSYSVTSNNQDLIETQQESVPSLPPTFGPSLPPHLIQKVSEDRNEKSDSDSEDGFLGPLPADHPAAMTDYIQQQLEERARRMKNKLDAKDTVVDKREEWMIELPSARAANIGLDQKRQFRNRAGPDMSDRSSWTDTPADKARKKEEKQLGKTKATDQAEESERLAIRERDKAMEKMAEKHASKKRKESLLEIHKKKLHKKKKKEAKEAKEAGKPTRRPFDRDIDLQANRFDEAQKKSILNKAQLLNDRFSRGESKYL